MSNLPPAGWYPDPNVPQQNRYWDGAKWTEHTSPPAESTPPSAPSHDGRIEPNEPAETGLKRLTTPQRVSAISIVVVALAAFMPWASVFGISKVGVEGDGIITLILAIVGAAVLTYSTGLVGASRSPGRASQIVLLVLAAIVALIGLLDMSGVAAIGLYLTFFGGVAWVVGAVWQLARGGKSNTVKGS